MAVLLGHLSAGLAVGHLALHLGHLGALQLGHVGALLARHGAALPLAGLGALSARHVGALLGLHGVAHALLALLALLLGAVAGVLGLALLARHVLNKENIRGIVQAGKEICANLIGVRGIKNPSPHPETVALLKVTVTKAFVATMMLLRS